MVKWISTLTLVVMLCACGVSMGDRIDASNLQVYYLEDIEKNKAVKFAKYWKDNGFVGERKQVLQLSKEGGGHLILKIIEREMYHEDPLTVDERSKLQALERALQEKVFGEKVEIVITDNTFRPIERK